MGLETDITDIQSLNQNWPPVSDPRAQGADHIRNIKRAIQLTFPNLKQCLLNDAQFTALGTLVGDGSGTFTVNGKLTVSDTLTAKGTLLVPTVTDWTTQQAVGAKDAEGRYLKPGDADGRYAHDGATFTIGDNTNKDNSNILYGNSYRLSFQNDENLVLYDDSSNSVMFQISESSISWKGKALALSGDLNTEITNRTNADTDLQNQINNRVQKNGDTISWLQVSGATWTLGNSSAVYNSAVSRWTNSYVDSSGAATWDLNGGSPDNNTGNKSWLRMYADGTLRTGKDAVAFQSDLPLAVNQRIQSFSVSIADGGRITFPVSFSGVPTSIQLQCMQNASRITVANPTSDPQAWGIPSVGVQIVAGDHTQTVTTPITVWVTAIGPK